MTQKKYLTALIGECKGKPWLPKGNHGHQLQDLVGALTIAKTFGFSYVHSPHHYLDFSAVADGEQLLSEVPGLSALPTGTVSERSYEGLSFSEATQLFGNVPLNTLTVLDDTKSGAYGGTVRIYPWQTIRWYSEGLIQKNIFKDLTEELRKRFQKRHRARKTGFSGGEINISIHLDYHEANHDRLSHRQGHQWPMSYFENIVSQLERHYHGKKYKIRIYTERRNSKETVATFNDRKNIELCIGPDREEFHGENWREQSTGIVEDIFHKFVMSDVLVASNSDFSVTPTYFRGSMPTIYYPHDHLKDLPSGLATDLKGNFDVKRLKI